MVDTRALPLPDEAILSAALSYDPLTGDLSWVSQRGPKVAGSKAGTIDRQGYVMVMLNGRKLAAHRIAWKIMTGEDPASSLDHVNCERADNRWANLRLATASQNAINCTINSKKSGLPRGVSWDQTAFRAQINIAGKQICIGRYATAESASAAYEKLSTELHGEFKFGAGRPRREPTETDPEEES